MIQIANISITDRAAAVLQRERMNFRGGPGESFGMVYVSFFIEPDGTAVEGFRPAYMVGPLDAEGLDDRWAVATLPDGTEFVFMPRFRWSARQQYVVDTLGALFSIEPTSTALAS